MGIEEIIYQIAGVVGSEGFQNSFIATASGVIASACAATNHLQTIFKAKDSYVYSFMAGVGVMATYYLTESVEYSLASLIPFAVSSFLLPKPKAKPEDHSTHDEYTKKLKGIDKK